MECNTLLVVSGALGTVARLPLGPGEHLIALLDSSWLGGFNKSSVAGGEGLLLSDVCEHDTVDIGSKLITSRFLWSIDMECTDFKI